MSTDTAKFKIHGSEKLEGSQIKVTGTLLSAYVKSYEDKAAEELKKNVKLDGFRDGHVPTKIIKERMGELAIYEEAAELALNAAYIDILKELKTISITRPVVGITKISQDSDVEFSMTLVTFPEFEIPDYKKIIDENKKDDEKVDVTEKEIEDAINRLRHSFLHQHDHDHKHDESHDHKEGDLPEVNDEFIKHFGEFKDVEDFKSKVKESIVHEKGVRAREKKRLEVMNTILDKTTIDLPEVMVQNETDRLMMSMKDNISNMGLSYPDYLKHVNKTEDSLREELRPDAEKRAKIQLVLNRIAVNEKVVPEQSVVDHEVSMILKDIKDADPERTRAYVETMITNEKVWQILEGLPQTEVKKEADEEKK